MILQTANIISGAVLGAPKLKEWFGAEHIESIERVLTKHREIIGLITLVLGVIALLNRMDILDFHLYQLGSSYPQALAALASGILLYSHKLMRFSFMRGIIAALRPHEHIIGIIGIAVGLGSMLFGCPLCSVY